MIGRESLPLEPSPDEMRAMASAATASLVENISTLWEQPASQFDEIERLVGAPREPPPEAGEPFGDLLRQAVEGAAHGFTTTGPGFLAYIPGGGLWSAVVADFIAAGLNRFVTIWGAAPALVQIEWQAIRWLAELFGYPDTSSGIFTSGGSMSSFSAIVTARRARLGEDLTGGTLYVSEQTHASVLKAAVLAGFPRAHVRSLPTDASLRMDTEAARAAIRADRARGLRPFLVVATAGTTNTGAVDPIDNLADLAAEEGIWFHVDAAYGGFFYLTDRGRAAFRGIERTNSVTLDPHKGMFLPYGTGCLLVRDGQRLRDAHDIHVGEYMQDHIGNDLTPNFSDLSPELSRDFRGLRVWLPLKLHGVEAFRAALDEKLDLTQVLFEGIRDLPGMVIPWEPELSIVAFRLEPEGTTPEEADRATHLLLDRINASRRVFLSSTRLAGRTYIRPCILSHRTHRDRIDEAIEIIRRAVGELTPS